MPTLEQPAASAPRWKSIRDELCTLISQFQYGERFCSIAEICEKYEVSTITARRALDELQAMGLVEKIRSKGTVVRQLNKTTHIRLVVPVNLRPDYLSISVLLRRILAGIKTAADQHQVDFDTVSEAHLSTLFDNRQGSFGFLLISKVDKKTTDLLKNKNWPYVILNPLDKWKKHPHVRADRYQAGYMGARHLIGLGHRRIAYVLGSISRRNFRDRLQGYRAALEEAKIPFRWSLVHETDGENAQQDRQAVTELMELRSPPTAIMAGDDNRAIFILNALQKAGVKVPQEVSVLGYPNNPETRMTQPPLSVVDARYEQVGVAAVQLILAQIYENANPKNQAILMKPQLVERQTTASPPSKRISHS